MRPQMGASPASMQAKAPHGAEGSFISERAPVAEEVTASVSPVPIKRKVSPEKLPPEELALRRKMGQVSFAPLDFDKIKDFLLNAKDETQVCATLQALRWRVTKAPHRSAKREILHSYVHYDILGCAGKGAPVLQPLLDGSPRTRVYATNLVNALASECVGRSYLLQRVEGKSLVSRLADVLKGEKGDTGLRQNALGALQKFSLRRRPQSEMIAIDMVRWIANTLRAEGEALSEYTMEYATALLMNLSLRSSGKDKCEELGGEVLQVLIDLLENENPQVRTYVNGTLYSIFTRASLKEAANALGMHEMLQYLIQ